MPELSIIMPLYNTERYLKQAIQSLLSQTYTDFELIVVDDASTDGSKEILHSFSDKRIKILCNDKNQGIVFSRNKGLEKSVGKFIAPFDSDDIALPYKFMTQLRFLKENRDFGMLGSWIKLIDEYGDLLPEKWRFQAKPEQIPSQLLLRNYFAHSSIIIRREAIPEGGYLQGHDSVEDYRMWVDVAKKYKVWNYPEFLVHYRIHSGSISNQKIETLIENDAKVYQYVYRYLDICIDSELASLLHHINSKEMIIDGIKLKQIEAFLLLIISQNDRLHQYDRIQLAKVIRNRWLKTCYKARHIPLSMIRQFLESPLKKLYF